MKLPQLSMDSDEDSQLTSSQSRQYSALRSDLSAALAAFDRAQDWAVCHLSPQFTLSALQLASAITAYPLLRSDYIFEMFC